MRHLCLAVAAAALSVCGTASAQEVCSQPDETIAAVNTVDQVQREAPVKARSAYQCGRLWSASVILENAVATRPSVLARFNLATSYAATDRLAASAELFRSVVADGQFTTITLDPRPNGDLRSFRVNATDEATIRLADVERRLASDTAPAATTADLSDGTEPQTVEERVKAIVDEARVSGDRALFFDGLAPAPADLPTAAN